MHTLDRDFITWRVLRGIQISLEMRDFIFTQRFCRRFKMCWELKQNTGVFPLSRILVFQRVPSVFSDAVQRMRYVQGRRWEMWEWVGRGASGVSKVAKNWTPRLISQMKKNIFSPQQILYYLHTPWLYDPLGDSLDLLH